MGLSGCPTVHWKWRTRKCMTNPRMSTLFDTQNGGFLVRQVPDGGAYGVASALKQKTTWKKRHQHWRLSYSDSPRCSFAIWSHAASYTLHRVHKEPVQCDARLPEIIESNLNASENTYTDGLTKRIYRLVQSRYYSRMQTAVSGFPQRGQGIWGTDPRAQTEVQLMGSMSEAPYQ